MILRAIFWIGLVTLLMPREPDLGLGRPESTGAHLLSGVSSALTPAGSCESEKVTCTAALGLLDRVKLSGVHSLARVKAEIEEAERARGG